MAAPAEGAQEKSKEKPAQEKPKEKKKKKLDVDVTAADPDGGTEQVQVQDYTPIPCAGMSYAGRAPILREPAGTVEVVEVTYQVGLCRAGFYSSQVTLTDLS